MDLNNPFAMRMRELLEYKGMTQAEFARYTGLSTANVARYVQGINIAKDAMIRQISEACHINPDWLRGYDVPMIDGMEVEKPKYSLVKQQLIKSIENLTDEQCVKIQMLVDMVK